MELNETFGRIYKEYRLMNNLSQRELAEKMSKTSKTISQIETGRDGTSKETDICFMNVLEISPNKLYKNFIKNYKILKYINIEEKLSILSEEKLNELIKIIDKL